MLSRNPSLVRSVYFDIGRLPVLAHSQLEADAHGSHTRRALETLFVGTKVGDEVMPGDFVDLF